DPAPTPPRSRMEFRRADRIRRLPEHFFATLVQRVMDLQQQGHDLINLGQGNPDLPTPPHIVEALAEAARDPWTHRYCSPFSGLPTLKAAVAHAYRRDFDVDLDPARQVAILFGAKAGFGELPLVLLEKG